MGYFMDALYAILGFIIIILVTVIVFIPSLLMVMGLRWAAEKLPSNTNGWVRWGSVLIVMLVTPQIFNNFINRDVTKMLALSQPSADQKISANILAVKPLESRMTNRTICGEDCALLLLSGEIEEYLVVGPSTDSDIKEVTSFKFEETSDCNHINFLGRDIRSNLENIIREMSLSGRCLTSSESTLDIADVLVEYSTIEPDDKFLSRTKGLQTLVSRKNTSNGDWRVIQRDIGVRYREVFPVLLPAFSYANEKGPLDVLTKMKYRTEEKKFHCKTDWFSDFAPCHRQFKFRPASNILGLSVSTYRLEQDGVIETKLNRTISLSKLVKGIISENRNPNPNEWTLISDFISNEYPESETFSDLVIDVISNEKFPVPPIYFGLKQLSTEEKALVLTAAIQRIERESPGPIIGDESEETQWRSLYNIVKNSSTDLIEPHFNDLVDAVSKRPNNTQYVAFLEKFGAKSQKPILDLLKSDRKRLSSLSRIMCRMGPELKGIEGPLMEMANNHEISIKGNYGRVIYLLLELGVTEEDLLRTVKPDSFQASSNQKSIQRFIDKYNTKGKRCR